MKKHSTHRYFVHSIFLFFLLNYFCQESVAQCFTQDTKGYIVLESLDNVKDFVLADFRGKGISDLAVKFTTDSLVEILANDGAGNFSLDTAFNIPNSEYLTAGDLNADGKPDLIIQRKNAPAAVLINEGNGKFEVDSLNIPGYRHFHPNQYYDFNNDKLDDAFRLGGGNSFSVALDSGNNTFYESTLYPLYFYTDVYAVKDINGDKFRDLLFCTVMNDSGFIKIYSNNDSGKFFLSKSLYVPFISSTIDVADMNGDSLSDIIVADTTGSLHILLQDTAGNFHQSSITGALPNSYFHKISAADMNGDGRKDIIAMLTTGDLEVYFNNGNGEIDSSKHYVLRSSITNGVDTRFSLYPKDINSDGSPDIAIINAANHIALMMNDGEGNLGSPYLYEKWIGGKYCNNGVHISVSDANGDHIPDLLISNNGCNEFKCFSYSGNQNFKDDTLQIPDLGSETGNSDWVDLNNDGLPDLVCQAGFQRELYFLINRGNFQFNVADSLPLNHAFYAFGDFNNDGFPDLALADVKLFVYLNDGTGKFTLKLQRGLIFGAISICTADIYKDGNIDIIVGTDGYYDDNLAIYKNSGNASFYPYVSTISNFYSMSVADFNGDGYPDIFAQSIHYYPESIMISFNDSTGHFTKYSYYDGGVYPQNVRAADMNGDGRPDLLFNTNNNSRGEILFNNGDGTFGSPMILTNFLSCQGLDAADLNGDHKNDLILTDFAANTLNFYINCDTGEFTSVPGYTQPVNKVLSVFPNPTTGSFTVSLNAAGLNEPNSCLTIFNIYGQKIYQQRLIVNQNSIAQNVVPDDWAYGIYFVTIESGNESWETKFIKQ